MSVELRQTGFSDKVFLASLDSTVNSQQSEFINKFHNQGVIIDGLWKKTINIKFFNVNNHGNLIPLNNDNLIPLSEEKAPLIKLANDSTHMSIYILLKNSLVPHAAAWYGSYMVQHIPLNKDGSLPEVLPPSTYETALISFRSLPDIEREKAIIRQGHI
jgi:hypothetical protein